MSILKGLDINERGHLEFSGFNLKDLSEKYSTPLFIYDSDILRENYRTFFQAFRKRYDKTIVAYSIKTNYNIALCKIVQEEGAYAEVASGLDMYVAERAGFEPDHIIFDGPYKTKKDLYDAIEKRIFIINVESFSELEKIDRIAGELGVKQTVGLRINFSEPGIFNIYEATHCYPSKRFGFSKEEVIRVIEKALKMKNIDLAGVMTHPYHKGIDYLLPLVEDISRRLGVHFKYINFGGGFSAGTTWSITTRDLIKYDIRKKLGFKAKLTKENYRSNVESIAESLSEAVMKLQGDISEPTIIFEPGSYLVSDIGILLLRVDHVKQIGDYKWIITDGGTNLIPHFMEQHELSVINQHENSSESEEVNIAGPLLYDNDVIAIRRNLPKIYEGDILAVHDCGAYTLSKSTQFLQPRPAVLIVNSGNVVKIRERETYEYITKMDRII
ncbi:MAG: diaminopimelate decarboxylase family protein [Candidatus Hodarchaeota archaeon]